MTETQKQVSSLILLCSRPCSKTVRAIYRTYCTHRTYCILQEFFSPFQWDLQGNLHPQRFRAFRSLLIQVQVPESSGSSRDGGFFPKAPHRGGSPREGRWVTPDRKAPLPFGHHFRFSERVANMCWTAHVKKCCRNGPRRPKSQKMSTEGSQNGHKNGGQMMSQRVPGEMLRIELPPRQELNFQGWRGL